MSFLDRKKFLTIVAVAVLILALPITLVLVKHQQNIKSRAALPDQLEAEDGVLGGNAKIQTDSLASGGQYILFSNFKIIAGPTSQSITANSAEITWTLSEGATGQVEYGTTTSYGTLSTPENSFTYSTHVQTLSGLITGTTYHYRVKSTNQAGTQVVSADNTFTTSGGSGGTTPTPTGTQTGVGPRPAPATPTGANVYTVPSNIDGTGNTVVSDALNAWIAARPNGTATTPTIIVFPAGKTYKLFEGIHLNDRHYITFFGYGAKLDMTSTPSNYPSPGGWRGSAFFMNVGYYGVSSCSNLKFLGFEIAGNDSKAGDVGPDGFSGGPGESLMGIWGVTATDIEIADNYIHNVWSDAVGNYMYNEPNIKTARWEIHHNQIARVGRQGIVLANGDDWYIHHNWSHDLNMSWFDTEDARSEQYASTNGLRITDNLIERWSSWIDVNLYLSTGGPAYGDPSGSVQGYGTTIALNNSQFVGTMATVHDVYIERNVFRGGFMGYGGANYGRCNKGNSIIGMGFLSGFDSVQKYNVFIRDNRIDVPSNLQCGSGIRLLQCKSGCEITGNYLPGMTIGTTYSSNLNVSNNVAASVGDWPN